MNKLRDLANPYDFGNPVGDDRSFFGRTTEIADTAYYLNQAQLSRRPIHLAFVGARASGKTSLLNIAELEAKRKGFCTVRINLNEGDVETDFEFFRKLFHSVLMAAFACGAFGGKRGTAYFSYLSLVATNEILDAEQLPLIFAFQLAHAAKAKKDSFHVADDILADDLKAISAELNRPIIVLFDECNVLKANRIILEKLRNIFMNMSDYMLVFAATDDFFPVMDEVFSPIMRQFKKIEIGPFQAYDDVRDCVLKPLKNSGLSREDVKQLVPRMFLNDVDTLSGRRPYEVQLICHTMFKRCQEGSAKRFSLDLVTIQSIQRELASGHNVDQRPIIQSAKLLNRKTLAALGLIASTRIRLPAAHWWRIEFCFNANSKWTEETFHNSINELLAAEIIETRSDQIWFKGDDLDRIYIKYLARQKSITLQGNEMPFEAFIMGRLANVMAVYSALQPIGATSSPEAINDTPILAEILAVDNISVDSMRSVSASPWVEDLLAKVLQMEPGSEFILYELFINFGSNPVQAFMFWREPQQTSQLKKFHRTFEEFAGRCAGCGFSADWRSWPIKVPRQDVLAARINGLKNDQIATRLGRNLMGLVAHQYVDQKNPSRALELAKLAFMISPSRDTPEANNVGYLYMASGDFEEAKLWFEAGSQYRGEPDEAQLLLYNFGVLSALTGQITVAEDYFRRVGKELQKTNAACAYELYVNDGSLTHREVFDPPSIEVLASRALEAIQSCSNKC